MLTETIEVPMAKPKRDVQPLVNEMIWKHGANVYNRGNYFDVLREYNLTEDEVTAEHILLADELARRRAIGNVSDTKLEWEAPIEEQWDTSKVTHWKTRCGRYRITYARNECDQVTRYVAMFRKKGTGLERWDAISRKKDGECKDHKTLEAALESVEVFHCDFVGVAKVETNKHNVTMINRVGVVVKQLKSPMMTWEQIKKTLRDLVKQRGLVLPQEDEID